MPQPRILDFTPSQAEPTGMQKFFSDIHQGYTKEKQKQTDKVEIDKILQEFSQNKDSEFGLRDARFQLLSNNNISPTKRVEFTNALDAEQKAVDEKNKALNARYGKLKISSEDRLKQKQTLMDSGYADYESEQYLDAPASVQRQIDAQVKEEISRGMRPKPGSQNQPNETVAQNLDQNIKQPLDAAGQIISPGELTPAIDNAEIDKKQEWPVIEPPKGQTPKEQEQWKVKNEKRNNDELQKVQQKKQLYKDNKILISSMNQVNDSGKLPSGVGSLIIDPSTGDIRSEAQIAGLVNKETQLYVKNLKQFLKGAKEYFGSRVTNFDVTAFMAQLPSLMNSDDGRRLILKQMDLVNELESKYANTFDDAYKHYGRNSNYSDITKAVDNRMESSENKIISKLNNVVSASYELDKMAKNPEKFKNTVLMQDPDGQFMAVPKDKVEGRISKNWSKF